MNPNSINTPADLDAYLHTHQGNGAYSMAGSSVPADDGKDKINYIKNGVTSPSLAISTTRIGQAPGTKPFVDPSVLIDVEPQTRTELAELRFAIISCLRGNSNALNNFNRQPWNNGFRIKQLAGEDWIIGEPKRGTHYTLAPEAPVHAEIDQIQRLVIMLAPIASNLIDEKADKSTPLDSWLRSYGDPDRPRLEEGFEALEPLSANWKEYGLGYDQGTGQYIGGFASKPKMSKFDSRWSLLDRLEGLFVGEAFSSLAGYRTHSHTPQSVRHFIQHLLDGIVLLTDDALVLQTIMMYGFNSESRLVALDKLGKMATSDSYAKRALERFAQNRRMPEEYRNPLLQQRAQAYLDELS